MRTVHDQRKHLEAGIFRMRIDAAFFDSKRAGMDLEEALREAVGAGVLTLLSNRGAELRGLRDKELRETAWKRIQPGVAAIAQVTNLSQQRRHVVAVVTRCLTDIAFEFWDVHRESAATIG
jgi:hypothetical protein